MYTGLNDADTKEGRPKFRYDSKYSDAVVIDNRYVELLLRHRTRPTSLRRGRGCIPNAIKLSELRASGPNESLIC